jgi:hypothetical protein
VRLRHKSKLSDAMVSERLRIFFLSDWRIQPTEWIEALLADAGQVDVNVTNEGLRLSC